MEAGLELRSQLDVDRTRRVYRGLYEVAEVPFVRAGSQCLPNRRTPPFPRPPVPYPLPRQSHPGDTPSLS